VQECHGESSQISLITKLRNATIRKETLKVCLFVVRRALLWQEHTLGFAENVCATLYILLSTQQTTTWHTPYTAHVTTLDVLLQSVGAAAAVVAVREVSHEASRTAGGARALLTKVSDLVTLDLVVLENLHLDLLVAVLVLLGGGEDLLLLSTTTETEDEVEGGLLLNVVVSKGAAILELLASEDETLLIRGDTLLILDLLLHSLDGVRRLNIKGNGLTRESLYRVRKNQTLEMR